MPTWQDAGANRNEPEEVLRTVGGRLRTLRQQRVLTAGEATEFDTRLPHALGNAGEQPVEFLSLFGAQGERMRVVTAWEERPG
ncbi:cupin domain-containing protein [Streptomyces sp. NPDC050147]|uniref:cupin domain-containing protein n=1 Tax=Streptomyces sp. NPDC050147 TaxID=3155513 RepID=UPI0034147F0D